MMRPSRTVGVLVASELFAAVVGFGALILLARRLGARGFADFEYASAVAAWWLVVVRGGFDSIVYREAELPVGTSCSKARTRLIA